jgi:hypothetical protein
VLIAISDFINLTTKSLVMISHMDSRINMQILLRLFALIIHHTDGPAVDLAVNMW